MAQVIVWFLALAALLAGDASISKSLAADAGRRPGMMDGWEAEQRLTSGPGASQLAVNFARVVAADDRGFVHAVWYTTQDGQAQIYYGRSATGGKTWNPPIRLSDDPGAKLHPAIAVAGGHVYAVWHDFRNGNPNIYLKRSTDRGATWGPDIRLTSHPSGAAHPSVAAWGSRVHVVWVDNREGQAEVFARRAADGGATWGPETRLSDLPYDSWVPTVATSGNEVYVAWVDTRDGNEEEYIKVSRDAGSTWGPGIRLTHDRANSWAPSLAVSGRTVHLVWFDQKDSPVQPLEGEKKLDEVMRLLGLPVEPAPMGVMVPHPEAAARKRAEAKLRAIHGAAPAWVQRGGDAARLVTIMQKFERTARSRPSLEAEKKLDEGISLLGLAGRPAPPDDLGTGDAEALGKRIAGKVERIHAAAPGWVHRGGDPQKLQAILQEFGRLQHGGAAPSYRDKERKLDEAMELLGLPAVAAPLADVPKMYYGDALSLRVQDKMHRIHAAAPAWVRRGGDPKKLEALLKEFERRMRLAILEWEIYYKRSLDGGVTWGPDIRLTNAPGRSMRPSVAVRGNEVHVVWSDGREGNLATYYKRSADGGATWGPDLRLSDAPGDAMHANVAVSRQAVHVLWFDSRGGRDEIYYRRTVR